MLSCVAGAVVGEVQFLQRFKCPFFQLGVVFGGIHVSLGPRQKDLMCLGEVQHSVFVASTMFLWSSSVTSSALVPVSCFVGKPVSWGRWYFFFGRDRNLGILKGPLFHEAACVFFCGKRSIGKVGS